MKFFIWPIGITVVFLTVSLSANAAMYKCTDANGNVGFSDKACPAQQQEVLKKRTTFNSPETDPAESLPAIKSSTFAKVERIKPQAGGKKVTSSSPLANVYMKFLSAVNRCSRKGMMKHVSSTIAQEMSSATNSELKNGCRGFKMLLPRDFKDATEVIEGDRGKIQWLSVTTTTDGSTTETMKSEQTHNFVRENGVWKFGE